MTRIATAALALLLLCGCHHPRTLPESLTAIFADHLRQIDTTAILDSVHVRWTVRVTERMGNIFNDSIYVREYTGLKGLLSGATASGNKDSIEFINYEIRYMEQEIDSIGHSIGVSDTSHRYGSLVGCAYYISGKRKKVIDSTMVFVDTTSTLRFTDFMDSSLRRTVKLLH